VFESTSEGILITDAAFCIVAVNPAFTLITGYEAGVAMGKPSRMMTGASAQAEINRGMLEKLASAGHWQGEMKDRRKDGSWYPAWLSISAIRDPQGVISNYVGVFTDNTLRKEAERKLAFLADHDSLTGLLNRNGLMRIFRSVSIRPGRHRNRWCCISSIWTASRPSTIRSAIMPAISCWWRRLSACAPNSPRTTSWPASVATNSWCCWAPAKSRRQ